MINTINKILNHLISLAIAAVVLGAAILFIYIFTGAFAQANPYIRVGVLDTGLDLSDPRFRSVLCSSGHKDFSGEGLKDVNGHGTAISGLIKEYAGKANYCLVIIKYYSDKNSEGLTTSAYLHSLEYISTLQLTFVNFSGGGIAQAGNEKELIYRSYPTVFVVAAGNNGQDILEHPYYPAFYSTSNTVVVGSVDGNYQRAPFSNYGALVNVWEIGVDVLSEGLNGTYKRFRGTSFSTAIHTGKMVRDRALGK